MPERLPLAELTSEDAARLGDLSLALLDLRSVMDLCERLDAELEKPAGDQDWLLVEALWTAALVKYVRCFASGKRSTVEVSVFDGLDGAADTHQHFKNMRDKHVAHSVNPFEGVKVGVVLGGEPGAFCAEGIAVLERRLICTDRAGVQTLRRLASVAQKSLRLRCQTLRDTVLEWAKSQPPGTLQPGSLGLTTPGPEQAGDARE